ncbi:MAG: SDR family oxidoreductase [Acidimicrobiales bacterium]|jgi:NAD(P)-dependent dehydrogenase (short-subunit alcohol dehydrogenase family)
MGALEERVAVVTGGASGIGLASAMLMAQEGAKVVVVDADGQGAERAASEIGGVPVRADVSRHSQWDAVVEVVRSLGGVDVVHLNAGVETGEAELALLDDEQYRRIMGVNVDGVVFGVRALLPELEARGSGAIVVTASLAGIIAFPPDPVYGMTKHAVVGLVRSLAPYLEGKGVTINAICPGMVDTPLIDGRMREALTGSGYPLITPSSVAEAVLAAIAGPATGQAIVVQPGRPPLPYRFHGVPGPRVAGAEGKVPLDWMTEQGQRQAPPK